MTDRYWDGAVRRVVAEWRQTPTSDECVLELECGHRHMPGSRTASALVGSIKDMVTLERPLIRIPVEPLDRPARVCAKCRELRDARLDVAQKSESV